MKKIPIEEATLQQLRDFAQDSLGFEIHMNSNYATALAKVRATFSGDDITIRDEPAAEDVLQAPIAPQPAPRPVLASQGDVGPGWVKVRINITESPGGNERVPLSVNGKAMLVEREKDQVIPYHFYEALVRAVEFRYEMDETGHGVNPIPRKIAKYPHTVLSNGGPAPGEPAIAA